MSLGVRGQCPLLQVWDMQTSLHFWRDLLGFELVQCTRPADDTGWAWLRRGTDESCPRRSTNCQTGRRSPPPPPGGPRRYGHLFWLHRCGRPVREASRAESNHPIRTWRPTE
jgi:catechol 2,3-dioxygenase-like lactoylglutathione lyase family enzyme